MPSTLSELTKVDTDATVFRVISTNLSNVGIDVTNWNKSGAVYNILKTESITLASLSNLITNIAKMGLLSLSQGTWLTAYASDWFQTDRILSLPAIISVDVAIAPTGNPQTIKPSGLIIKRANGLRYVSTNTTSVSIPNDNSAVNFSFQAESP